MKGSRAALVVLLGLMSCAVAAAGPVAENAVRAENLQASGDVGAAEEALRAGYDALWQNGPLYTRKAVLVAGPAAAFGAYDARDGNVFAPGEAIRLYVEPAGYGFVVEDGRYRVSFQVDAEIIGANETVIWGRKDIHRFGVDSTARVFEFHETLVFDLEGLPLGEYQIAISLTDMASGKSTRVVTPIEIR